MLSSYSTTAAINNVYAMMTQTNIIKHCDGRPSSNKIKFPSLNVMPDLWRATVVPGWRHGEVERWRGQIHHLGQWTLSRNALNFPTQCSALGLDLNFTFDSASEAELHKGSGFLEHSLVSYKVTNICFPILFDNQ